MLRRASLAIVATLAIVALAAVPASTDSLGIGNVPQGTQSDTAYAASAAGVTNILATNQRTSCYRPEVPYSTSLFPANGYDGMTTCPGADTGEDTGLGSAYPTQAGSNPNYPATEPKLVKDHSESDIRVDPTNANHIIGQSKWFVSAEGYNHLLGFYESMDGGKTWPVQGHVPGYEGWTDNTDPIGAFDRYGNFYSVILPYQFFYDGDTKSYQTNPNREPNPSLPAEAISVSVRPHGSTTAQQWITRNSAGKPDLVAAYDSVGRESDKQWIAIDTNPSSPHVDTIYVMWVIFTGPSTSHPFVSIAHALPNGTHSDWSAPIPLPQVGGTPQGATYLLPHVIPDGTLFTTLVTTMPKKGYCCDVLFLDKSTDGGLTWSSKLITDTIAAPPLVYANTTFRDGIEESFGVGPARVGRDHKYPLYVTWEDYSAGVTNILLAASYDEGQTWTPPIQVNDNRTSVDEFQPNLDVAANGTVSVAFYDRRLACPEAGTAEAAGAGIALDTANVNYSGTLPPYGAANYCVNASIQFYTPTLAPKGHNIRLTQHTWDPQLHSPHTSCPTCRNTFIGDYFGIASGSGMSYTTSITTYNDGTNPSHYQQQVIAILAIP